MWAKSNDIGNHIERELVSGSLCGETYSADFGQEERRNVMNISYYSEENRGAAILQDGEPLLAVIVCNMG